MVIYLSEHLNKRNGTPVTGCETFVADLRLMARHIRANAGYTNYPLRFGAIADELLMMADKIHEAP